MIHFVYGGSWASGSRTDYTFVGRALAAAGFLVAIADYRLIPEIEYPVFLDDCADSHAWLAVNCDRFGGDASRLALMGHSAGAYNAIMLLLSPRYAVRGVAANAKAFVGLSGPYDFYPFDVPPSLRAFSAAADPRSTQPINLVREGLPPMLLATGDADTLVYPRNTVALAGRLRETGNAVVERHYPGIGHAGALLALGRLGRHRAPILADTIAFLRAHL